MIPVPPITLALALALLVVAPVSLATGRRGGRFRGLPRWVGFWGFFAPLLVLLSRAQRILTLPLLGILMFVALREYFFLAPLRPRDRWAILAAYLTIPLALFLSLEGSFTLFLALVPLALLVVLPVLLALAPPQAGLFESAGRVLVGTVAFVYCAAHLGLMAEGFDHGEIELYGILLLGSELPRRLAGRARGEGLLRPLLGMVAGAVVASALGAALGRFGGLATRQGAVAGIVVAIGAGAGAFLAEGMAQDLNQSASASRIGRAALLDQTFPALYAAPAFFHYLTYLMAFR
jgi:predicted CDP-diglyceride synthetase/phosphatidate cytidylyltransferase